MSENNISDDQPLLFHHDTAEQAGEFFRLAMPLLMRNRLPTNPVNISLAYNYIAGRSPRLKETFDRILAEQADWPQDEADNLFRRFVYSCDSEVLDDLRSEILNIVAQTISTLVDLAGKTAMSSNCFEQHIDKLARSRETKDVLNAVSDLLTDARNLATETKRLESELTVSSKEMSKLKEELECTRQEVFTDALTGVLNRRGFDRSLQDLIKDAEQRRSADFSLILLDLDNFKVINDSQGHLIGDKVLRTVGILLQKHTKGRDVSARFGGDEFALLLPETRLTSAFNLAENLRIGIQKLVLRRSSTGERLADITASFGVAAYRMGEESDTLLDRCDAALYRAKKLERNRVVLAD